MSVNPGKWEIIEVVFFLQLQQWITYKMLDILGDNDSDNFIFLKFFWGIFLFLFVQLDGIHRPEDAL